MLHDGVNTRFLVRSRPLNAVSYRLAAAKEVISAVVALVLPHPLVTGRHAGTPLQVVGVRREDYFAVPPQQIAAGLRRCGAVVANQ